MIMNGLAVMHSTAHGEWVEVRAESSDGGVVTFSLAAEVAIAAGARLSAAGLAAERVSSAQTEAQPRTSTRRGAFGS
jgi:hypothetical protein